MPRNRTFERTVMGLGGALLIASLFLPWTADRSGWDAAESLSVMCALVGTIAVLAAATGGRAGLMRPDVSVNGATDVLSVLASIVLAWFVLFELSDVDAGAIVALAAVMAVAGAAGDWTPLRRSRG